MMRRIKEREAMNAKTVNAWKLAQRIGEVVELGDEGFTLDPTTFEFPFFGGNEYVVSIRGHEGRFHWPMNFTDIYRWLCVNVQGLHEDGRYVGGWLDAGYSVYVLDISTIVIGLENALVFAVENGQDAIYNPAESRPLYINDLVRRVA